MTYSWIITKDHIDTDSVGVEGPSGSTHDWKANPDAGVEFKLYDDDEELYYTGRYVGDTSEDLFGPLDDYGTPNAGCTLIQYKNEKGVWEFV